MNPIYVIGISYDYGVVTHAGYFTNKEDAEGWIKKEHKKELEDHKLFLEDYESSDKDFKENYKFLATEEPSYTGYYVAEVYPSQAK